MHNLQGKSAVTLTTMGGLVTYASPDNIPSGVSPRCHDVDFTVGGIKSRKGTRGVYSFSGITVVEPGHDASSTAWANPLNAISTTLFATASGTSIGLLDVVQFAFNVSQPVVGIQVNLNGTCNTPGNITAQLIQQGAPIGFPKVLACPVTSFGGPLDTWGATPNYNDTTFGVRFTADSTFALASFLLNSVSVTLSLASSFANFQYVKSFIQDNGNIKTLAIDADGEWWVEDITNDPGVLNPLLSGLPYGWAKSVTQFDREYVCFNDLSTGNDIPRQYTGDWIDRITQVGPGAPPAFTPQVNTGNTYPISTITQVAGQSRTSSYFLQSAGPGSATAGNVVTFYYSDATLSGPDQDLIDALNSGFPVYAYVSFTGTPEPFGPQVVQILSAGQAPPPNQPRAFYYFTFVVSGVAYTYFPGSGHPGYTANYQRTLATMTTAVPVPGLIVSSRGTISGASVANYDSTWLISQTLNSGNMVISQTSVASGVATYSYALASGAPPAAGELETVTGTTNANGVLNVTNGTIATASGGSTGTFTINLTAPDAAPAAESGQGSTAGTQFAFDPGFALLGSATSPIYGNSTGGTLTFVGTSQFISPGTRQGVVFFGTRNDAETFPSIPVTFTIPTNTSTLISSLIPIGPPNVTYRQIAITEPGQEGIPGGDFYTIDDPVNYTVNGVAYVSNSFRIPNNTDTSISLTFRDSDLLAGRRIDVTGEDLFNQVEIGNPAWTVSYASRMFYGLTQSRVYNFLNLSFDGGYHPATIKQPLGWNLVQPAGQLLVSPIFGDSYYIKGGLPGTNVNVPIPPPVSPPSGQSMAWSSAQTFGPPGSVFIPKSIWNGNKGVSGASSASATSGGAAIVGGDVFADPFLGVSWSNWLMPPEIPPGATITAIYAAVQGSFQGQDANASVVSPAGSFLLGNTPSFTGTTYSPTLGTSLASIVINSGARSSLPGGSSTAAVYFTALAIYYDDPANITHTTVFVPDPGPVSPTPGMITQSAYRDFYQVEIIRPLIPYSVRVTARIPSGNTVGNLNIDLFTAQQTIGIATFPFSSMTTVMQTLILPLTDGIGPVPTDLLLRVYGTGMGQGADVEIDRIEVFPTRQPINNTDILASYPDNPEGVDGDTGNVDTASENTQPCYGAFVMYDLLYLLKDRSMYYTQDSSGDEPSKWGVHEVSNKAGACGVNAYDSGEEWGIMANRNGVYLFTGGEPRKILQEIQQIWDSLNWAAGRSIWIRNDVAKRVVRIGVPMPTPNFWLPDAPVNAAPTFPNVILKCFYEGSDTGTAITDANPIFATQFGNIDSTDLRRKWTIDQIPCPYADFITQQNGSDAPLLYGNGINNSKIYILDQTNDDGAEIPWRYVTYGFGNDTDAKNYPSLGAGRKRWSIFIATVKVVGQAIVSFFSNRLDGNIKYSTTLNTTNPDYDVDRPLNVPGNRVFVELKSGGINSELDLSQLTMAGTKDVYQSLTGRD